MKLKGKISISRWSGPDGPGIGIRIQDELSGIEFVDADMTIEEYGLLISGLASRPIEMEVRGLQNVGKKRIHEKRHASISEEFLKANGYARYGDHKTKTKTYEQYIDEHLQQEGWVVSSYLGSQGSVSHRDGKVILNYSACKYVDPE